MFGLFKSRPLYRVSPRPKGKWGIDRAMAAGFELIYMPLFETYDTEQEALDDVKHLCQTRDRATDE